MNITLEQVKAANPKMIFHSAHTMWWTHDPADLCKPSARAQEKIKEKLGQEALDRMMKSPIPLDCFDSPLFQSEKVNEWLNEKALADCEAYGSAPNRLRNFMLMHAQNVKAVIEKVPKEELASVMTVAGFVNWVEKNYGEGTGKEAAGLQG